MHVCMLVRLCSCMHACIPARMHVCMHVCMCLFVRMPALCCCGSCWCILSSVPVCPPACCFCPWGCFHLMAWHVAWVAGWRGQPGAELAAEPALQVRHHDQRIAGGYAKQPLHQQWMVRSPPLFSTLPFSRSSLFPWLSCADSTPIPLCAPGRRRHTSSSL
jgi:hypothetical protein